MAGDSGRSPTDEEESQSEEDALAALLERVAHVLPAQGPISEFVHHNTLHAFENRPFEEAVAVAARRLGCEPFLAEAALRDELGRGRIGADDVAAILARELGDAAAEPIAAGLDRRAVWLPILLHGVPAAEGSSLGWLLSETDALERLRPEVPADARATLLGAQPTPDEEARRVRALWRACRAAAERSEPAAGEAPPRRVRPRDLLLALGAPNLDAWIDPILIRFVAAFLDQGLAHWPLGKRDRGLYGCFLATYGRPLAALCGPWARDLPRVLADERRASRTPLASLAESLRALGAPPAEWEELLAQEALALRGWAGMVRQLEERPDRAPAFAVPARLVDYLAVRLLLTRVAVSHAARQVGVEATLPALRAAGPPPRGGAPGPRERAWRLFHGAQFWGLREATLGALDPDDVAALDAELARLQAGATRRLLHLAYERHLRCRLYDALSQHVAPPTPSKPAFQAVFCVDDREESIRRHLEEVAPEAETLGAAGFYGVAMYYRGATDAHPRPLCPVSVRPTHLVAEVSATETSRSDRWRVASARAAARVDRQLHLGSRTFVRGGVLMAAVGALWAVPLVLRVLFPGLQRRLAHRGPPPTRLDLEGASGGADAGFTVDEMTEIVGRQLGSLGLLERAAPLVVVVGHGSTSLNNPHESAHDCGACGGGRGGPNARAFAQMANDPRVREGLADAGTPLPAGAWFVGAQRNTASNELIFYDTDRVPPAHRPVFERARDAFERARAREAQERCRWFDGLPGWLTASLALFHVEARSADLAQPRPEYGHASNAFCVVGRRARTRGLFLDRRAFLASYDPTRDPDGAVLAGLLAALVPVVAGINLEYFFGAVDPTGYGSGTKLPHNVTALLGVMDGAESDLRTGLPWQMLEIHEPVRLTLVVEADEAVLARALEGDARFRALVAHRWIFLARLEVDGSGLVEVDLDQARPYIPERPLERSPGSSLAFCGGKPGHLPFAQLAAAAGAGGVA